MSKSKEKLTIKKILFITIIWRSRFSPRPDMPRLKGYPRWRESLTPVPGEEIDMPQLKRCEFENILPRI